MAGNVRYWHFGDIRAPWFNVRLGGLFGHQRVACLCREMTQMYGPAVHRKRLSEWCGRRKIMMLSTFRLGAEAAFLLSARGT